MNTRITTRFLAYVTRTMAVELLLAVALPGAAMAGDFHGPNWSVQPPPPYNHLNLSPSQAEEIRSLDDDWKGKYLQLQPRLQGEQKHLASLLAAPKSDPLDITSTQSHINILKEQLSGYATTNFLKKRRVLTPTQQREVESWMKQMIMRQPKLNY